MKVSIEIDDYLAGKIRQLARESWDETLVELTIKIESAQREAIVARATRNSLVSPPLPRLDEPPIETGEQVHGPPTTQG